ncbi:hypothetical protein ACJX0J_010856, partial [Zea mays]
MPWLKARKHIYTTFALCYHFTILFFQIMNGNPQDLVNGTDSPLPLKKSEILSLGTPATKSIKTPAVRLGQKKIRVWLTSREKKEKILSSGTFGIFRGESGSHCHLSGGGGGGGGDPVPAVSFCHKLEDELVNRALTQSSSHWGHMPIDHSL